MRSEFRQKYRRMLEKAIDQVRGYSRKVPDYHHAVDLGTIDATGNIRLKDRIKDTIVRGGENTYATDMEAIAHTHPSIRECQVVGFRDDRLGEKTVACTIPKDPSQEIA
jgi:acyl-CoA synthetase (AMP-forming)/AMP-acid ligase II